MMGGSTIHGPKDIPEVGRFAVMTDPQGAHFRGDSAQPAVVSLTHGARSASSSGLQRYHPPRGVPGCQPLDCVRRLRLRGVARRSGRVPNAGAVEQAGAYPSISR